MLGTLALGGTPSCDDQIADVAIFAFDKAVDNMAEDATAHHPATEREELLSAYIYRTYRDIATGADDAAALGAAGPQPADAAPDGTLLAHYTDAEDAAAYVADAATVRRRSQGARRCRDRDGGADHRPRLHRICGLGILRPSEATRSNRKRRWSGGGRAGTVLGGLFAS